VKINVLGFKQFAFQRFSLFITFHNWRVVAALFLERLGSSSIFTDPGITISGLHVLEIKVLVNRN
jgi:hypothetical protein